MPITDWAWSISTRPKYDEAIKQFQKQIEINPLDQNAHANLGLLYVNQKRYADAIPELEKAIDIHPKNPLLQISLGQAYIATNQTEKGMAAFDKAITLAPVPVTWNNIAYSLSQQNVQLDRADKYSDSAMNAIETQLRDVNLDSLRMQDLAPATFCSTRGTPRAGSSSSAATSTWRKRTSRRLAGGGTAR